ncbi:hypothetical protein COLO4_36228 [Corchorus olitorius]|uniref:Uncharacterized protein n=1 Tax=Corchorus olitorius TaxID=93759 RepID=A0A1R3GAA2_9ROSI|nr:hypothetical protein COLO4_36228 [Corchorus olitorius]
MRLFFDNKMLLFRTSPFQQPILLVELLIKVLAIPISRVDQIRDRIVVIPGAIALIPPLSRKSLVKFVTSLDTLPKNCRRGMQFFTATPSVNLATIPSGDKIPWCMDIGVSHHVTNAFNNLTLASDYEGFDKVIVGDGTA